ncbi:chromate transporter [Neobacillus notoginsengisoli]|uniref:Chromate transporter n=1 Tax=Neobacillus notoginsengisoli TaxID=1578198 RepID=A0A417YR64_9BACI|nr:chromate transporter [Neobacillus notoginsengisoli]RHW37342.1 chromate transporter [Neobacillus notoginsengisoli]
MKQKEIFLAFFRVGMLGYGGGPSAIPLVQKEVVSRYKWVDSDEFGDILALANALPGPIATKLAGYIGYRVGGVTGMLNAIFASIVPTIFLMILLLTSLNAFKEEPWVRGAAKAVVPVVAIMLLTMTWEFFAKSMRSSLGIGWTIIVLAGSFILLIAIGVHPAIIIFTLLLGALLKPDKKKEEGRA